MKKFFFFFKFPIIELKNYRNFHLIKWKFIEIKNYIDSDLIKLREKYLFWIDIFLNLSIIQYIFFIYYFFSGIIPVFFIIFVWFILFYLVIDYLFFLIDIFFFKLFFKDLSKNKIYDYYILIWAWINFIFGKIFFICEFFIYFVIQMLTFKFWKDILLNYILFYPKKIFRIILHKIDQAFLIGFLFLIECINKLIKWLPLFYSTLLFKYDKMLDDIEDQKKILKKKKADLIVVYLEFVKKKRYNILYKILLHPIYIKYLKIWIKLNKYLNFLFGKWFWLYFFKLYFFDLFLINIINMIKFIFIKIYYWLKSKLFVLIQFFEKINIFLDNSILTKYYLKIYLINNIKFLNKVFNFIFIKSLNFIYLLNLNNMQFIFVYYYLNYEWINLSWNNELKFFLWLMYDIKYFKQYYYRFQEVGEFLEFKYFYIILFKWSLYNYNYNLYNFLNLYWKLYFKLFLKKYKGIIKI